jgi:hypothetical protein
MAAMKTKRSHSPYGVLRLSRPTLRQLQSEWQAVERPSPIALLTPQTNDAPFFPPVSDRTHRDAA